MILKSTEYKVSINRSAWEKITRKRGLKQEHLLSISLFNLVLEKVVRETELKTKRKDYFQLV